MLDRAEPLYMFFTTHALFQAGQPRSMGNPSYLIIIALYALRGLERDGGSFRTGESFGCLFIGPEAAGSTEAVAGLSEGFTNVLTSSLPVTLDME